MRLIDADALIRKIAQLREDFGIRANEDMIVNETQVIKFIKQAPTIDRPTRSQFKRMAAQLGYEAVVHCKDCKHWRHNLENETYCSLVNGLTDPEEDDFCSYGERKADADEPVGT